MLGTLLLPIYENCLNYKMSICRDITQSPKIMMLISLMATMTPMKESSSPKSNHHRNIHKNTNVHHRHMQSKLPGSLLMRQY